MNYRLDGLTDSDLRRLATWRNAQRELLRSPGFTHECLQRDWLLEMRRLGGLVAAIRTVPPVGQTGSLAGYVALYPRHGDYAELGWLHDDTISDAVCVQLSLAFASEANCAFLVAETLEPGPRAEALLLHDFHRLPHPVLPDRIFWVRAV